ncbi:MAG: FkbM family methyltransferase [Silicimonas sp.]|nr:FkbM family methyltransferase [Silicimonas sp.]NNL73109.1 FkbM family methyltransferase [Silicimonas sp.]
MGLKTQFAKAANVVLRPLRMEMWKTTPTDLTNLTMQGGLERAKAHGIAFNTAVDVGASDGSWSKLLLGVYPASHVLAFEPLEERTRSLDAMRQTHPRFDYVGAVAGEQAGDVRFHVGDDLDSSGIIDGDTDASRSVRVATIDDEIRQRNLPGPYLIKLDTHGFELPILKGAANTLADTSLLIVEVYNFQLTDTSLRFHEMCAHLETLGFRTFDMADPMLRTRDRAFWQMDLFFTRKDAPLFAADTYV